MSTLNRNWVVGSIVVRIGKLRGFQVAVDYIHYSLKSCREVLLQAPSPAFLTFAFLSAIHFFPRRLKKRYMRFYARRMSLISLYYSPCADGAAFGPI